MQVYLLSSMISQSSVNSTTLEPFWHISRLRINYYIDSYPICHKEPGPPVLPGTAQAGDMCSAC